ncbi:UDP-glucose dehydrogenase family protein [Paenactinomyces guangxiensis]|uniref:UDP-glucose 6-dehydrogenase n=1 Tax=Paenactinomyces guangxiensis TaxID=1490290 RepID=A0A7W2AAR4_9BACL|nr:UDP-glucose/GDP-mannose dehydrogenase family protein [Paenactinomyces guangxiensis]MBA4496532.1 UDP-glucose/GDP-mannose dehydrogenase family protein [Paenactinomyces guangxiensis]MBH8593657.1 UDP-glucose/GDP-mannose dehydrogenase family protein [Paenactinomyces guangxiensis]
MKVAVIGTGYVGTTTSIAFASQGYKVIGIDNDEEKIKRLNQSKLPFYEEGLDGILQKYILDGTLSFTSNLEESMEQCDILFVTVGTPASQDGSADLSSVIEVARQIGSVMKDYKVIVIKSTVPIGTGAKLKNIIQSELKKRQLDISFDLVSNPEFLRQGKALHDAVYPERIVIGCETDKAREIMEEFYKNVKSKLLFTTVRDAEMIKYASNAFLATKISFINELARICEKTETNIVQVAKGMGMDSRINPQFLQAGLGFGGSCFPKDTKALLALASEKETPMNILKAVLHVNQTQTDWFMEKVKKTLNSLSGKRIAILGLTFKPQTDDIREAPSLKIINYLIKHKAHMAAYDPQGTENVKKIYPDIRYATTPLEAMAGADAVLIVTEWKEIIDIDWKNAKRVLSQPIVFDGRNALDSAIMSKLGYYYMGVGILKS